jgi:hypothetical protein
MKTSRPKKRNRKYLLRVAATATVVTSGLVVAGCGNSPDLIGSAPSTFDAGGDSGDAGLVGKVSVDAGLVSTDANFFEDSAGASFIDAGLSVSDAMTGNSVIDAGL